MKKWLILTVAVVILLCPAKLLALDIYGYLNTGMNSTQIDSVQWFFFAQPRPVMESTPDWGGPPSTLDTFQFSSKEQWPIRIELFARVNGIPRSFVIDQIVADTWYDIEGSTVRFDTTLSGLQGTIHNKLLHLTVTPNPTPYGCIQLHGLPPTNWAKVQIYTPDGALVINRTISSINSNALLNLRHLPKGVYMLKVRVENTTWQQKLILLN